VKKDSFLRCNSPPTLCDWNNPWSTERWETPLWRTSCRPPPKKTLFSSVYLSPYCWITETYSENVQVKAPVMQCSHLVSYTSVLGT